MPREEPPAELHRRIVRSIELPRRSRWREWLGPLNATTVLRYGVAGAAGAVLTLGVIASRDSLDGPADFSQMAGTIARGAELPVAGRVDNFSVTGEGARAEGVLSTTKDGWLLQLDLAGAGPLDLAVDLAGTGLHFAGVARRDAGLQGLDWSGQILAGRITGPERLTLLLQGSGDGGAIGVSLAGDGIPKVEAQLDTKQD
jgi:hypothetical protein